MRGKISVNPNQTGVQVLITNFEGKSKEEMIAYAQKVVDRNGYKAYKVQSVGPRFRDETTMVAVAWVP